MKKKLLVVPLMLFAVTAHAGEGLIIIDVMPRHGQWWHSMVEYMILGGRALGLI